MSLEKDEKDLYRLPFPVAAPKLVEIRNELRAKNLHDTEEPAFEKSDGPVSPEVRAYRTNDGISNDLSCPRMGSAGTRFGRNFPLSETFPDTAHLMSPSPRTVSLELLTRTKFQEATIVNLLAAAWIQFQVHDWFMHKPGSRANTHKIPLADRDTWPERPMQVPVTPPDPAKVEGSTRPPAYANENSHWWDGSQVYGSTTSIQATVRAGRDGKVIVGEDGRLKVDPATGIEITGFTDNTWVGLSLLHALFALEHNAICDRLKREYPSWDDERLFQQARLVNSALMAKIHTTEWTPAILPNPVTAAGLRANWHGLLGDLQKVLTGLNDNDLLGGIPGSPTDHHTAPYSLTEEFVAIYRMHSLMPDDYTIRSSVNHAVLGQFELPEMSGARGRTIVEQFSPADLLYSMGVAHPGALRLFNYPKHLQTLVNDSGERFDIATIDILRDRERGVPRYNQFRRLLHKRPVTSFEELSDIPDVAAAIKRVYNNDLEKVDLLVGLMAEPLPPGFGFSETAFRLFILMASRRLKSDRFLSKDYRPEVYTKTGFDWVESTSMLDIIKRHVPGVGPALKGVKNAFQPWTQVG